MENNENVKLGYSESTEETVEQYREYLKKIECKEKEENDDIIKEYESYKKYNPDSLITFEDYKKQQELLNETSDIEFDNSEFDSTILNGGFNDDEILNDSSISKTFDYIDNVYNKFNSDEEYRNKLMGISSKIKTKDEMPTFNLNEFKKLKESEIKEDKVEEYNNEMQHHTLNSFSKTCDYDTNDKEVEECKKTIEAMPKFSLANFKAIKEKENNGSTC